MVNSEFQILLNKFDLHVSLSYFDFLEHFWKKIRKIFISIESRMRRCEKFEVFRYIWDFVLNLRRPLRRKLRMRWFLDISKVKESSFLKSDLTDPPQIFDAHLLENTDLSPSRFHFSVGFISRLCFESDGFIAYSNEWDWREKNDVYLH